MERYRKGNFNQGRKFSRYDSQTSLNLKNINNLNANVELEMGLKVEEKRMFYEEESGKFLFCVCACLIFPPRRRRRGVMLYIETPLIKEPISPPPPFLLYIYSITLLLFYSIYSLLSLLCYKRLDTKKNLHRGGVLGRDCQRPRRQTGSKHERRG